MYSKEVIILIQGQCLWQLNNITIIAYPYVQSPESITRLKSNEKGERRNGFWALTLCQALFYVFSYYGGK